MTDRGNIGWCFDCSGSLVDALENECADFIAPHKNRAVEQSFRRGTMVVVEMVSYCVVNGLIMKCYWVTERVCAWFVLAMIDRWRDGGPGVMWVILNNFEGDSLSFFMALRVSFNNAVRWCAQWKVKHKHCDLTVTQNTYHRYRSSWCHVRQTILIINPGQIQEEL